MSCLPFLILHKYINRILIVCEWAWKCMWNQQVTLGKIQMKKKKLKQLCV